MTRPPRDRRAPLLDRPLLVRTLVVSVTLTAVALGLFEFARHEGLTVAVAQTTAVTGAVLLQALYLIGCRSLTRSNRELGHWSNPAVYWASGSSWHFRPCSSSHPSCRASSAPPLSELARSCGRRHRRPFCRHVAGGALAGTPRAHAPVLVASSSLGNSSSARSLAIQASAPSRSARAANEGSSSTPTTMTRTASRCGPVPARTWDVERRSRSSTTTTSGRWRRTPSATSCIDAAMPTSTIPGRLCSREARAWRAKPSRSANRTRTWAGSAHPAQPASVNA